jgi:5-formyltetrahydrofolate cyclo-ligase
VWAIRVPAEGAVVLPDVLLMPLVGFDQRCFRHGYGRGYYDQTLATMPEQPLTIGVGFEMSRLTTIHPQHHAIPMDLIVTERHLVRAGSSP